jgi:hypothetical protein
MSYEESIVSDIPMKCTDEELAEMALKHYQGISSAVLHWNSTIETSIKEYPRLKRLADNRRADIIKAWERGYQTANRVRHRQEEKLYRLLAEEQQVLEEK